MRRFSVSAILASVLGCALLVALPGEASARQGTITGRVIDGTNQQPLVGAQVFLIGTSLNTITNQDGRYLLPAVPAGQYTVEATLIGYSQGTQTVTVTSGATATVDFALNISAVPLMPWS